MTAEDKKKVLAVLDKLMEGTSGVVRATIMACKCAVDEMEVEEKWIPVAERLPEVGKDVLVYSEYDGVSIDYHGGDSFGYALVTHWMPLPEPPKEEGR